MKIFKQKGFFALNMEEIPTYLYRVYNADGEWYAFKSGSEKVSFDGMSRKTEGFARGLVKVVQEKKIALNPIWDKPPDEKDIILHNSLLINDTIDVKEKPRIAKAIVKELVRALSGK